MSATDAMGAFVDEARAVPIETEVARRGLRLKRAGSELVGPCPVCGGVDRFGVNQRKGVFLCRHSGAAGDVIAMAQYLDGCDFLRACETLTGRPPPKGEGRWPYPEEIARREAARQAAQAERERGEIDYRETERARMWHLWRETVRIAEGGVVARYLAGRGLPLPFGAALREHAAVPFFVQDGRGKPQQIHIGPAMVAACVDAAGTFRGAHITWLDAERAVKAEIVDPSTGEVLPARKMRGSMKGSHIALSPLVPAKRLIIGEGNETVLSVRLFLEASRPDDASGSMFWAGISLGNIGGRAKESVPHPSEVRIDKRGAARRVRVPGPEPDLDSSVPSLMPPEEIGEVILLGDSDSDRFTTEMHLRRAAARWRRPGRTIRLAWAPDGFDFNDVLMGRAA